jgi:hypothetical protein
VYIKISTRCCIKETHIKCTNLEVRGCGKINHVNIYQGIRHVNLVGVKAGEVAQTSNLSYSEVEIGKMELQCQTG